MRILMTSVLCLAATASQAGSFGPASRAGSVQPTPIVRVADGCGLAFHADGRGICRPNGERVVVIERPQPVIVERPVVVARPRPVIVERPVVVERRPQVVEEVVVRRPVVPTCGLRIGPLAVRGAC